MGDFDLREVLAGRGYPTAKVRVLLDDEIAYRIRGAHDSGADSGEIERLIEERDAQLFTVHLRGISNQSRNTIRSKALHELPVKLDVYGREDQARVEERQRIAAELYFAEHIQKVVTPTGAEQVWTEENKRDLARAFLDMAPDAAIKTVEAAMEQLAGRSVEEFSRVADIDFLSRT